MTDKEHSARTKPNAIFRLDREILDEVAEAAERLEKTRTACFTEAVMMWLRKHRKTAA